MISTQSETSLILEFFDRAGLWKRIYTSHGEQITLPSLDIAEPADLVTGSIDLSDDESTVFQVRSPLSSQFATEKGVEYGHENRLCRVSAYDHEKQSLKTLFIGYVISTEAVSSKYLQVNIAHIGALVSGFDEGWTLSTLCPHRFKSARCSYSGAEAACDKTVQRCAELSNMNNHGGMPFLSLGEDK